MPRVCFSLNGGRGSVSMDESAIEVLTEFIDPFFVTFDNDDFVPSFEENFRRHHGQRTGSNKYGSHCARALLSRQVPGYTTISRAMISMRPASISKQSTPFSHPGSSVVVMPVERPTVPAA